MLETTASGSSITVHGVALAPQEVTLSSICGQRRQKWERSSTEGERLAARAVEHREQGPPSGHDRTRGGDGGESRFCSSCPDLDVHTQEALGASEMLEG